MYRQSMIYTFDVWAEDEEDATEIIANMFHEVPHEWWPVHTEVVDVDDDFNPINEEE